MGEGRRNTLRCFNAAQIRHAYIENRDVRLSRLSLINRLPSIRRFGDHDEFGLVFQQKPQAAAHYGVIVS